MQEMKISRSQITASSGMQVKVYVINDGSASQYYGLKNADENTVLHSAPNNWKTRKAAENWAKKKGFTVVGAANVMSSSKISDKEYYTALADGVVRAYNEYWPTGDLIYDITDKAISFADGGSVIYTQLVSDITPHIDDLQDDIRQLADAVIESRGKNNKSDEVVFL
jgi:hypothetical protein